MFGASFDEQAASSSDEAIYPTQIRIDTVCIFGGAAVGHDPRLEATTALLGETIAKAGLCLVYGGGCEGLMGAIAGSAIMAGGEVIAIAPRFLMDKMSMPNGLSHAIGVPKRSGTLNGHFASPIA